MDYVFETQIIFDQMSKRPTLPIFQEIEQEDKQKLDEIIFNILGLSENERQNVYTAICVLVKNRVEKAKTFGKTVKGKKEEFNPVTYAEHILSEVFNKKEKKEFPKDFVSKSWDTITIELPSIDETIQMFNLTQKKAKAVWTELENKF